MTKIDIRKKFGRRLKKIRKELKLSQEELAKISDLHRTYIGSIERGDQNISLENVYKLSKALKMSLKDLVDF